MNDSLEIHAREFLSPLTVGGAFNSIATHVNEYGELANHHYEQALSQVTDLEQEAFTMLLVAANVVVVDADVVTEFPAKNVKVLTLEELRKLLIEEDKRSGGISKEFYSDLLNDVDKVTARRLNKWLVKTGIPLNIPKVPTPPKIMPSEPKMGPTGKPRKGPIHPKYKKRLEKELSRKPS